MAVFDTCLSAGRFPAWEKARMVVLSKSSEKTRLYRPISLLPVLGKTLERLTIAKIECKVTERMYDAQHGFRRG